MSTPRISRSAVLQATVWIGLWLLFTLTGDTANRSSAAYLLITLRIAGFAVYYNLLYYAVLPRYFSGRKRSFYGWAVLAFGLFVAYSITCDLLFVDAVRTAGGDGAQGEERPLGWVIVPAIFLGLAVFGVAATFRGFTAFEEKKASEEEAKRQRLEAEIALLKSQINPHFLLNTINNLYVLALTQPDRTPDALLKLSEMVSYILYECASPRVPLARDLQFIESYVDLQRLRLSPNARLEVRLPASVSDSVMIEPMILVNFVENAFKHGLTTQRPCTIALAIELAGGQLSMQVENPVLPHKAEGMGNPSGIGMPNTRQRLDHAYAGKYTLRVDDTDGIHRVTLAINLDV
ncbi:sensor histidine kinase [Lewinella sp. IMCC34191]|uniref:sensor histidine kinase n=1 Tax=Lewinella sp. IMCC34191 TaxID=2259172 RepID=UPI000E24FBB2|nr:histidine kinase [Lewinella sp. IMCC34191]